MGALLLVFGIVLLLSFYNIFLGVVYRKRYKHIKHLHAIENTQSNFATARYELVKGVFLNKVDPNSFVFESLYKLNTAFMRNPDRYKELNKVLVDFITTTSEHKPEEQVSKGELEEQDEYLKQASILTAEALGNFIIDYSWFWKNIYRIGTLINKEFEPSHFLMMPFISEKNKEKIEIQKHSIEAKQVLKENKYIPQAVYA